jgi:hypothetical protein
VAKASTKSSSGRYYAMLKSILVIALLICSGCSIITVAGAAVTVAATGVMAILPKDEKQN